MAKALIVEAYADGSSTGKRGAGGWGIVMIGIPGREAAVELSGGEAETTNQRMEITAALEAIRAAPDGARLVLYSDSAYVVNCLRQGWYRTWRANGWKNSRKEPVANRDLWEELLEARLKLGGLDVRKVRGHARTGRYKEGNDRADFLAVAAKKQIEGERGRARTDGDEA